jgi:hypothetical protein
LAVKTVIWHGDFWWIAKSQESRKFFGHKKLKKPPQKVDSEFFLLLPNSPNGRIHVPKCGL